MNPTAFSIVIITLNEEKNIERCLHSLKGLTDDLVVVDSGSDDKTEEICRKYGAKFVIRPFDNFSDQKNYANQLALHDWIVSVDADEEANTQLHQCLSEFTPLDEKWVGIFNRKTNYCGKWIRFSGLRNDCIKRVFNKKQYRWQGDIHEKLFPNPAEVMILKGRLHHYTYQTYDDHIKAAVGYTRKQADEYFRKGKKIRFHHLLFSPLFRFLKHYFFYLGFLDGFEGYLIAKISAFGTFSKYARAKWMAIDHLRKTN